MEEPIRVTPKKDFLIVGILDDALFIPLMVLSVHIFLQDNEIDRAIMCAVVFGLFCLLGVVLIYCYFRHKLVFFPNCFTVTPIFGTVKTIYYFEVQALRFGVTTKSGTEFTFISHEGRKLAEFSSKMHNYGEALLFLQERGLRFEQSTNRVNQQAREEKQIEQIIDEDYYIFSRWSPERIVKEKRIVNILRVGLMLVLVLSFFIPVIWRLRCYIFVLLFIYGMILWTYPKMIMSDAQNPYQLPFPLITCFSVAVLIIYWCDFFNIDDTNSFLIHFSCSAILLVLYILTLLIKRRKESIKKMLEVLFGVIMIAAGILLVIMPATTFGNIYGVSVTVVDKYHDEQYENEYYIVGEYNNSYPYFEVSRRLYRTAQPGDTLMLYEGQSIFGARWYALFEESTVFY